MIPSIHVHDAVWHVAYDYCSCTLSETRDSHAYGGKAERGIPPVAHLRFPDRGTILVVLSATTQSALAVPPGADCRVCDGTTIAYGRSRPDHFGST